MAMTAKQIRDAAAKLGIPMLPEDHPYYSEGPQTLFLSRTSSQSKQKVDDSTSTDGKASTKQPKENE